MCDHSRFVHFPLNFVFCCLRHFVFQMITHSLLLVDLFKRSKCNPTTKREFVNVFFCFAQSDMFSCRIVNHNSIIIDAANWCVGERISSENKQFLLHIRMQKKKHLRLLGFLRILSRWSTHFRALLNASKSDACTESFGCFVQLNTKEKKTVSHNPKTNSNSCEFFSFLFLSLVKCFSSSTYTQKKSHEDLLFQLSNSWAHA